MRDFEYFSENGVLPHCEIEERALLGSILIDPFVIDAVRHNGFGAQDFYLNRHKVVFEAMCNLWDTSQPIDTVLLADELNILHKLDEAGGQSYLFDLATCTPTSIHGPHYAHKVKRYAMLRNYITLAGDITQKAYDGMEPDELFAHIQEAMHRMNTGTDRDAALMTWEESFDYTKRLLDFYDQRDETDLRGWSWRWESWNRLIDPIEPGMLAVIAAGDGTGKTSYAECLADWWAIQGKKVVFVHFELNRRVMIARRLCRHARMSNSRVKANNKTQQERADLAAAETRIAKWEGGINYLHTPGWSVDRTIKELTYLHEQGQCDVVLYDYLEKAGVSAKQQRLSRWEREADNVSQIKDFAESKEVRFVMLSQLNKEGKKKEASDLTRMDGRGAGEKSEFSNIYVILHREKLEEGRKLGDQWIVEPGGYDKYVSVRVDKNTLGPTGSLKQYIDAEHFDVHDVTEEPNGR